LRRQACFRSLYEKTSTGNDFYASETIPNKKWNQLRDNEPDLRAGLKRRGATETRIAIFKNVFCQGQLREKDHTRRALAVGRAVLAHNLYVLAKLQAAQQKAAEKAAAKARGESEQPCAWKNLPPPEADRAKSTKKPRPHRRTAAEPHPDATNFE